jgi:phage/plasmid primase-like uncharacterized protein
MRLDADAVRALLTPAAILDYYEIERRGGFQLSVRLCPQCGQLKRGSVSIHAENGLWRCHSCGARGGIFDLVAGYAGLDRKTDFGRVVRQAAVIAGVPHGMPDEERDRLLAEHRTKRAELSAREEARRARIRARMPMIWNGLDRRSVKGEGYLRDRGIDPEPLRARDVVRFLTNGDPAMALHDLATGEIVGIQYRHLSGARKLTCQTGSQASGACLLGKVAEIGRLTVLVEGLADTLVARLAWPDAAIFGAPGAEHLETIAIAIAPHVVRARGVLLVVPDDDPDKADGSVGVGIKNAARAVVAAMSAGLELVDRVRQDDEAKMQIVDLGKNLADQRHHDLADAWKMSRWRWKWPT